MMEDRLTVQFFDSEEFPLFRVLSPEEEVTFRQHARANYHPGTSINSVFHPVWRDEARKMNEELGISL